MRKHIPKTFFYSGKQWFRIPFPFHMLTKYYISKDAKVLSILTNERKTIIKGKYNNGFLAVDVSQYRYKERIKKHTYSYGELLLMTFSRKQRKNEVAVHLHGKRNSIRNLRWMTRAKMFERMHLENKRMGFYKLTTEKVKKIKRLAHSGMSTTPLSKRFKLSKMQIQRVVRGDSWPDVLPRLSRKKLKKAGTSLTLVNRIKRALQGNNVNQKKLAERYGVGETTVSRIKLGKYYKS